MENSGTHFVICVKTDGYHASLEPRKVYEIKPDDNAEAQGLLRVTDESGEDYLYPHEFFVPIQLTQQVQNALTHTLRS